MKTLCATIIVSLVFAGVSAAQPLPAEKIKAMMDKNLALEKDGKYREAFAGWKEVMDLPDLRVPKLENPELQKIFCLAYFYTARNYNKLAIHDPEIKDRQKAISLAANLLINVELQKSRQGWEIVGPMLQDYFKDKEAEQLKKAYDKLKSERK